VTTQAGGTTQVSVTTQATAAAPAAQR
jgi:hypothetical protein